MNEALAVNFGIHKWRVFLWGRAFTLLTDCRALIWLLSYEGTNAAVRRLQFEILGFWFTIWHRPESANKDADGISRIGVDYSIDPTLAHYYKLAYELKSKYPCVQGDIEPSKLPGYRRNLRRKKQLATASANFSNTNTFTDEAATFSSAQFAQAMKSIVDHDNPINNIPITVEQIHCEDTNANSTIQRTKTNNATDE